MRFLIALALIVGCDDGTDGLQGFYLDGSPNVPLDDGGCPDPRGLAPVDWIAQEEIDAANNEGIYSCFIYHRMYFSVLFRCANISGQHPSYSEIMRSCEGRNDEFRQEGVVDCPSLWAELRCFEIDWLDPPCDALVNVPDPFACP